MSKITRPDADVQAFASQSLANERHIFGTPATISDDLTANMNADYLRGWFAPGDPVNTFPSVQDFSAQMFTTSQLVSYLFQMGISEWNTNQFYPENARAMDATGTIWKSLQDHTGQAQIEGLYWTTGAATAAEIRTGTDNKKPVTSKGINDTIFGMGQTWQDVVSSRTVGVSYPNSTGRPIQVIVSIEEGGTAVKEIKATIDGIIVQQMRTFQGDNADDYVSVSVTVPEGSTYKVDYTGTVKDIIWAELR